RGASLGKDGRMTAARALFDWKVRGFRVVEIIGVVLLAAVVFSVYFTKAEAARHSAEIDALQGRIVEERRRVRLLGAEAARLEEPGRLEALSRVAGLAPVAAPQRASIESLDDLAVRPSAPSSSTPSAGGETP